MDAQRVFKISFASVYLLYVQKAETKRRKKIRAGSVRDRQVALSQLGTQLETDAQSSGDRRKVTMLRNGARSVDVRRKTEMTCRDSMGNATSSESMRRRPRGTRPRRQGEDERAGTLPLRLRAALTSRFRKCRQVDSTPATDSAEWREQTWPGRY